VDSVLHRGVAMSVRLATMNENAKVSS
jgi:hypothetical protein